MSRDGASNSIRRRFNVSTTGRSDQKTPGPISAVKRHFNSYHAPAPAFSVGGSVITEWASSAEGTNNSLAVAVRSLRLSLW